MKPSRSGAVMRRDVFKLSRMPAGDDAQALAARSEALFSQRQQLLTNLNLDPRPACRKRGSRRDPQPYSAASSGDSGG